MEELLRHSAVQGAAAPFVAALLVVAVLQFVRLGGLAAAAGFCVAVYLISGFSISPLTATRKIVLLGVAAPLVGMLIDFASKPTRIGHAVLGLAAGAAAVWTFFGVLQQKELSQALLVGGGVAVFLAWLVVFGLTQSENSVRAGAIGLGLGAGAGVAGVLGGSALYGSYAIALGAGATAFLLWQMITGKRVAAGATFILPATIVPGLLLAGTMILAQLPWYTLAGFALLPLATLLPFPEKAPVSVQATVASTYALVVAAGACAMAWYAAGGISG